MASKLAEVVEALEADTWKAMSKDGAGLLPYLSKDCRMMFPLGLTISNESEPSIEQVMKSKVFVPWKSYTMKDVQVTGLGDDAAIISYRVKAYRPDIDGMDSEFRALMSSTWRKDPSTDKWEMCFHQQTPYDQTAADLA